MIVPFKRTKAVRKDTTSTFVDPNDLANILPITATVVITFRNSRAMQNYRSMLYSINKQGTFRYRTMRDEMSMWGLCVWRMK